MADSEPRVEIDTGGWWTVALGSTEVADTSEPFSQEEVSALERLLHTVEAHAKAEEGAIDAYHRLAAAATDPTVAVLLRLIIEDEERHHSVLRRMATMVRDDLHGRNLPGAPSPAMFPTAAAENAIRSIRSARGDERDGIRRFRELARGSRGMYGGLLALLLDLMAMDSRKHELILRFVEGRLRAGRARAPERSEQEG